MNKADANKTNDTIRWEYRKKVELPATLLISGVLMVYIIVPLLFYWLT